MTESDYGPKHVPAMGERQVHVDVDKEQPRETPTEKMLRLYFQYSHLGHELQKASMPICEAAETLEGIVPDGPEKTVGMRKLLEAKDCFVRAMLRGSDGS